MFDRWSKIACRTVLDIFLRRKVQVETERYLSDGTRLHSFLLQRSPLPAPLRGPLPPFRPPSPSPRPSPPLDPLLSLSCSSRGSPSSCTLPPSSLPPPRRPTGCTLTCNERDRPAGTQLPLAPCISESVSQSVSQSLSQLVGESGRRYTRDGGIVSALNYLHSLFARNVLSLPFSLSPFLVVFFVVLSCEIYSRRGSFGRVVCCWPRASLFAARV